MKAGAVLFLVLLFGTDVLDSQFVPEEEDCGGLEDESEKWCYVNAREGVHMFYWLYRTYHEDGYLNRPLILWLQGGPGGSSVGYGNFDIIGPRDISLQPRNTTWVKTANILFVDTPVGTGYSYAEQPEDFTTTQEEADQDLFALLTVFFETNPEYKTAPFYIFGQSYGGKSAASFSKFLYNQINDGNIEANLVGYAMGNAWTSPVDSTVTWAPFLYYMSNVDEEGFADIDGVAKQCATAVEEERWVQATSLWASTQGAVNRRTNYVDFYNVLKYRVFTKGGGRHLERLQKMGRELAIDEEVFHTVLAPMMQDPLDDLMNGIIKEQVGIVPEDIVWGAQSDQVFNRQAGDFMKPVVDIVGELLETTDLTTVVYQGQLDLICDTKGALDWVLDLEQYWSGFDNYYRADKIALTDVTGQTDTFVKAYNQFKFYWNLRAGHAVPKDDGEGAYRMVNRIIDDVDN